MAPLPWSYKFALTTHLVGVNVVGPLCAAAATLELSEDHADGDKCEERAEGVGSLPLR